MCAHRLLPCPGRAAGATVFTNPFQEMEDEEKRVSEREARRKEQDAAAASDPTTNKVRTLNAPCLLCRHTQSRMPASGHVSMHPMHP